MISVTYFEFEQLIKPKIIKHFSEYETKSIISYLGEFYLGTIPNSLAIINYNEVDLNNKINELLNDKPIQQLVNFAYFNNEKYAINLSTLIPRTETEELVHWIINNHSTLSSILDIGTGTGCIAIELSKHYKLASVLAYDVCENAIEMGKLNNKIHKTNVQFQCFDILKNVHVATPNKLDCIVSNPPYILDIEKKTMDKNVLNYEPHMALFCGDDVLKFYNAISDFALINLNPKGYLYFETHCDYAKHVMKMLDSKGFEEVELKKDNFNKERMVRARLI
jgi:release factor glutamine methyltransferase